MKKVKLYNVLFPVWMLIIFSPIIFIVLGGNFIIDSIVLLVLATVLKVGLSKKEVYKNAILKVWVFGFVADIIGAIFLLLTQLLVFIPFVYKYLTGPVAYNCFENPLACLYTFICIAISGFFIYLFNYKVIFKKLDMAIEKKRQMALWLAIITAPYMFLIPTSWLYY